MKPQNYTQFNGAADGVGRTCQTRAKPAALVIRHRRNSDSTWIWDRRSEIGQRWPDPSETDQSTLLAGWNRPLSPGLAPANYVAVAASLAGCTPRGLHPD